MTRRRWPRSRSRSSERAGVVRQGGTSRSMASRSRWMLVVDASRTTHRVGFAKEERRMSGGRSEMKTYLYVDGENFATRARKLDEELKEDSLQREDLKEYVDRWHVKQF